MSAIDDVCARMQQVSTTVRDRATLGLPMTEDELAAMAGLSPEDLREYFLNLFAGLASAARR